jgi:hypothetical protein
MSDDGETILYFIPSLIATLLNREKAKGSPLTEEEVISIRDNSPCVALTPKVATEMDHKRGYPDIDAEYAWPQWQEARLELTREDEEKA